MRRLDPTNPADRPFIARNVTAMAIAVFMVTVAAFVLVAAIVAVWPLRLMFAVLSVVVAYPLAYHIWLFREMRRNPALAAGFQYAPRALIRPEKRLHLVLAVAGTGLLVLSGRLLEQARIQPSGSLLWSARALATLAVITMLAAAVGLLRPNRPQSDRGP